MKRVGLMFFIFLVTFNQLKSQSNDKKNGEFFAKLFFDAYTHIGEENNPTAMEIQRVYFGYNYNYTDEIQANFKLDIGSPENESAYSLVRRFAYFKNAFVSYKKNGLTINMGLIDVLMFKNQENLWGHRYIEKSYLDRFKFGPSADIGAHIEYNWSKFTADFGIYNGEGYKNLQFDNSYRAGFGLSYKPSKRIISRFYLDYSERTIKRITYTGFLGYNWDNKLMLGAEASYQSNYYFVNDRDIYGYSGFGSWNINDKWQFFSRYDMVYSNIPANEDSPWNLGSDGSSIITGFQYKLIKGILLSLNYQDWVSYASNISGKKSIYFNLEAKF